MTFSIIARDPENGAVGVATATGSIAVGAQVPHCRFGAGAVATQGHTTNILIARRGLPLLAEGGHAPEVLDRLLSADQGREFRQVAMLDAKGGTAGWTGAANSDSKGHLEGRNFIVAGNLLAGPKVLPAMRAAFESAAGTDFALRLLAALKGGEAAGGDARGTCSAALLVDSGCGAPLDLRIDFDAAPVAALHHLHERSQDETYREFLRRLPSERTSSGY